mgnify:FL=1
MEKSRKITNFARFYAVLKRLPYVGDRDDLKRELVSQATLGRTEHLRKMTREEYDNCCRIMEKAAGPDIKERGRYEQKRKRSTVLHLMRDIGVDTTDWNVINRFCRNPKISGKTFRELSDDELDETAMRLRMILKKEER